MGSSILTPLPRIRTKAHFATQGATIDDKCRLHAPAIEQPFQLLGVSSFSGPEAHASCALALDGETTIEVTSSEFPTLVRATNASADISSTLLKEGLCIINLADTPPESYRLSAAEAQASARGTWQLIKQREAKEALERSCPTQCCQGVPCDMKPTCEQQWKCKFCRDDRNTRKWRVRLAGLDLENGETWLNPKVCLSVGDGRADNCVLAGERLSPAGIFDLDYGTTALRNGFLKVLGTTVSGVEQRLGHMPVNLTISPSTVCSGFNFRTGFVRRNGDIKSVRLQLLSTE